MEPASKIMDLDLNGNCAASEVGNCTVESPTALLVLTMWPSILPFELKFSEIFLKLARSTTLTVIPLKKTLSTFTLLSLLRRMEE